MKHFFILLLLWSGVAQSQSRNLDLAPLIAESPTASTSFADDRLFAAPLALDLSTLVVGEWQFNNGINGRWELNISLPGTAGLSVFLDELNLPMGGEVFLEGEEIVDGKRRTIQSQRWSQSNATAAGRLHTGFLPGESVTLVYEGPIFSPERPAFRLWRIDHVVRPDLFDPQLRPKDFGESNDCQVNANCPAGDGWDSEKSGTARIIVIVEEGSGYCSGNLLNNTAEDGRPFFLTGYHCQYNFTPLYDLWRFDFGYRSAGCDDPGSEPDFVSYQGAILRSGTRDNDFLLLELADPDFDVAMHYFAGWDRNDGAVSGELFAFHHPMGDIQKMGRANGMNVLNGSIDWDGGFTTPAQHHFRMEYDLGTFEVGSSGSAVFDENRRVRGQLSGGNPSCPGTTEAFIGRLHLSWTGGGTVDTRLSDWLDPLGLNPMTLDGNTLMGNTGGRIMRGKATFNGSVLPGVRLVFNWGSQRDTIFTDSRGEYTVTRPEDAESVSISTRYESASNLNGVNVIDIVAIRRHILALDTLSALELVAADVNNTGGETTGDIVEISQVILGNRNWTDRPNWFVFPSLLSLDPLPTNAFGPFGVTINNPDAGVITFDFIALKNGDVNFDATPGN